MPARARVDRDCEARSRYASRAMFRRMAHHVSVALALAGCSADSVAPPEPVIETPGTFVAATDSDGVMILLRTLRIIPLPNRQSIYDAIVYSGEPSSYEEAKTWAMDPDWPVGSPHSSYAYEGQILTWQPEAVWYRSLTREELAALF
jgi:hypothetical protein